MLNTDKYIKALLPWKVCMAFLWAMALFLLPGKSFSHPHVFIESQLEVELGDRGVKGIWQHWTFDEFFSAWVVDEYDVDRDGLFSPEETSKLYEEAFKNLKNYGFWTRVFNGSREITVDRIENFSVELKDNMVTYSFFVPLDIEVSAEGSQLFIAVYDESFYCQIFFPPQEVSFMGNVSAWNVEHSTQKMPDLTYYFGFVTPVAVKVSIAAG